MILQVNLSGIAREFSGREQITLAIKNADEFHKVLVNAIPELNDYFYSVSINGKLIHDFSILKEDDQILIFSAIAGG